MADDPKECETLILEVQQAVQYWISKAIRPANSIGKSDSYGLKHHFAFEPNILCFHTAVSIV